MWYMTVWATRVALEVTFSGSAAKACLREWWSQRSLEEGVLGEGRTSREKRARRTYSVGGGEDGLVPAAHE